MVKRAGARGWKRPRGGAVPSLKNKAAAMLARALENAERDPEGFKNEAARIARQLGVSIDELKNLVRSVRKADLGNLLISAGARALKKDLGL